MAKSSRPKGTYITPTFIPGVEAPIIRALMPCDAYKLVHWAMYPPHTANLYFVYTARGKSGGLFTDLAWDFDYAKAAVFAILDDFVDAVIQLAREGSRGKITQALNAKLMRVFGDTEFAQTFTAKLKDLGNYVRSTKKLPLVVQARKSASHVPFRTPLLVVTGEASIPMRFAWLPGYFETAILHSLWHYMTALTMAREYHALTTKYAKETGVDLAFVSSQCHDFAMRGMSNLSAALAAGAAHLKYFSGSDTIIAGNNAASAFASEHSVMCAEGQAGEANTFARLLKTFPRGILSLVSDTYNIWRVVDEILPALKKQILARDGKLVIRPDSGDPVRIVCGHNYDPANKSTWGVIHYLAHHFGTTKNQDGYLELHPQIGIIYGDAMTYARCEALLAALKAQGFASNNIVFGIGASTYQALTRDTLGFVSKSTAICIRGQNNKKTWHNLFKNPVTDPSKKSLTGRFLNDRELVRIY